MIKHLISPVYNEKSRILILGSFPSVKSREVNFFYGHPQNRFWQVLACIFSSELPQSIEKKRDFLLLHRIAVWDVIGACDIQGSADSTIKNVVPNDLNVILGKSDIRNIFVNGKTAEKYYNMYSKEKIKRNAICLPSTSPANAAWSLERLIEAWKIIKT